MSAEQDALIDRIVARVRQELQAREQQQLVPPLAVVRGTWSDESAMKLGAPDRVGTDGSVAASDRSIASRIDHTLLKPDATRPELVKLCEEARTYGFASVCINTTW